MPSDTAAPGAASRFPCEQCGAMLVFEPGAGTLRCGYCGHDNPLPQSDAQVIEHDYRAAIAGLAGREEVQDHLDVKCDSCAAQVHGIEGRTSTVCPFCGSPIVTTGISRKLIKPHALLPFKVTRRAASDAFTAWIGRLWFAPSDLKKAAQVDGRLTGIYLPAWTFDARTTTNYTGQRGDAYYVTVPYTTTVNGRSVVRTRQERRVRWSPRAGTVNNAFDDVLVIASRSLPDTLVHDLEPWDLPDVVPYDDAYLSGFVAESYTTDLPTGFTQAQALMRPEIEVTVRAHIGGDEQRVTSLRTAYDGVTFKHILLPVWVAAYRYRGRVFQFLVNARTGEVRGKRPYSSAKIAALVVTIILLMGAVAMAITFMKH